MVKLISRRPRTYEYSPLRTDIREIRLIEILPISDSIDIRLHKHALNTAPPFEALTYTVGLAKDGFEDFAAIHCGGLPIDIPAEIYSFLEISQRHSRRPLFWIDAICINMKDWEERQHGRSFMNAVYAKATRTIGWLGIASMLDFSNLESPMSTVVDSMRGLISFADADPAQLGIKVTPQLVHTFHKVTENIPRALWRTIDELLERRFFTRTWVLQEIICSLNPVLKCGESELSWSLLAEFLGLCMLFNVESSPRSQMAMNVLAGESLRRRCHKLSGREAPKAYEVFLTLRYCKLNFDLPSDRLFVGFSLIKGLLSNENFAITYNEAPEHIYDFVSKLVDEDSRSLVSLSLASEQAASPLSSNGFKPAIDWRFPASRFLLNHPGSTFSAPNEHEFNALIASQSEYLIKLKGRVADTIRKVASYLPPRRSCDHYNIDAGNSCLFDEWYDFAAQHCSSSLTKDIILSNFVDTIQARGCNHAWEQAEQSPSERFGTAEAFLSYLTDEDMELTDNMRLFYAGCYPSHGRRFAITQGKRFCLVPKDATAGDVVCFLDGNKVPVVLKPSYSEREEHHFKNKGEVYVHGLMQGDSRSAWYQQLKEEEFIVSF